MLRGPKAHRRGQVLNRPPRLRWRLPTLDPPIFNNGPRLLKEHLSISDIKACGSIIRHIAFIDRVPKWARPRFAAKMGLDQMSAAAQIRWTHRFLEDRKQLLKLKFEKLAAKFEETRTLEALSPQRRNSSNQGPHNHSTPSSKCASTSS